MNPDKFGLHLSFVDGTNFSLGYTEEAFSIQSISKVFILALAKEIIGDDLWKHVGVEPSGNPYSSLTQLLYNWKMKMEYIETRLLTLVLL